MIFQLKGVFQIQGKLQRHKGRNSKQKIHYYKFICKSQNNISILLSLFPFQFPISSNHLQILYLKSKSIKYNLVAKKQNKISLFKVKSGITQQILTRKFSKGWNNIFAALQVSGQIKIVFGHKSEPQAFKCLIKNFTINQITNFSCQSFLIMNEKEEKKRLFNFEDVENFPSEVAKIKDKKDKGPLYFEKQKQRILFCLDYKNNYLSDVHRFGTGESYRPFFIPFCTDLIYFSHHLYSPPPKAYIDLCKNYRINLYGTIIFQNVEGYQNFKLFQFSNLSCQQFAGWLINIQSNIQKEYLQKVFNFLKYLKNNNYKTIWYDSIIHSGQVKYQSQLNQLNLNFFNHSDFFFIDYHWNQQKLFNTIAVSQSLNRRYDVFIGHDVFGRGTFKGGKFNSYLASKMCNQNEASIAIFAPGWTHQIANNQLQYIQNEMQLYYGIESKTVEPSFQYKNNWQIITENNCEIAITSNLLCQRKCRYNIQNQGIRKVEFRFEVAGSIPLPNDYFNSFIKVYDQKNKLLKQIYYQNTVQLKKSQLKYKLIKLTVMCQDLQKGNYVFQFVQIGRDCKNWAGNYGARFKNSKIVIKKDKQQYMCIYLKKNRINFIPFHTFYNQGQGKLYYVDGSSSHSPNENYDLLNQFDFYFCYYRKQIRNFNGILMNGKWDAQISKKGWNGGSSLQINYSLKKKQFFCLKMLKTNFQQKLLIIRIIIFNKYPSIYLGLKLNNKKQITLQKYESATPNQLQFRFFNQNQNTVKGIYLICQNNTNNFINSYFNIGSFQITTNQILNNQKIIIPFQNPIKWIKQIQVYKTPYKQLKDKIYMDIHIKFNQEFDKNKYCIKYIRIYLYLYILQEIIYGFIHVIKIVQYKKQKQKINILKIKSQILFSKQLANQVLKFKLKQLKLFKQIYHNICIFIDILQIYNIIFLFSKYILIILQIVYFHSNFNNFSLHQLFFTNIKDLNVYFEDEIITNGNQFFSRIFYYLTVFKRFLFVVIFNLHIDQQFFTQP